MKLRILLAAALLTTYLSAMERPTGMDESEDPSYTITCIISVEAHRDESKKIEELFEALDCKDILRVRSLIDNRIDVNIKNEHGITPLMIAIKNKDEEMVKMLLDNGALVNFEGRWG